MKTNQIYSMLNSMSREIIGTEALTVKDTATFVSFFKVVFGVSTVWVVGGGCGAVLASSFSTTSSISPYEINRFHPLSII